MKLLRLSVALIVIIFHLFLLERKVSFISSVAVRDEPSITLTDLPKEYLENQGQIVNNEYSDKKFDKVDSKLLAAKNQKYEHETKARVIDKFNKSTAVARVKSFSQINGEFQKLLKDGLFSEQKRSQHVDDIKADSSKPASNNDYLENIPLGEFTKLNTQESKYYGFYFRIRQRLESMWGMSVQEKVQMLFRSGGRLPASEDNVTALSVVLDASGKIIQIILKKSSGTHELDDAAIDSFNQAGPFPNPPPGMIHEGFARIDWTFVVKG